MANVNMPQGSQVGGTVANILPIVGRAFGPIGAAIGGVAGGLVGGMSGNDAKKNAQVAGAATANEATTAMQRRKQEMDNDPNVAIESAAKALELAPEEIKKEYGPALDQAREIAFKQRQMSGPGGAPRPY
jgi:hypothetical protein